MVDISVDTLRAVKAYVEEQIHAFFCDTTVYILLYVGREQFETTTHTSTVCYAIRSPDPYLMRRDRWRQTSCSSVAGGLGIFSMKLFEKLFL